MRYLIILVYLIIFNSLTHQYEANNILVRHPIIKIPTESSESAAGYFSIENNSENDIKLLKLESKVSEIQEMHEVVVEDSIYKMRPIKSAITIKSNSKIVFKPKSYHIMFLNLKEKLKSDEFYAAKLIFSDNLAINIKFKVVIGGHSHKHD